MQFLLRPRSKNPRPRDLELRATKALPLRPRDAATAVGGDLNSRKSTILPVSFGGFRCSLACERRAPISARPAFGGHRHRGPDAGHLLRPEGKPAGVGPR